VQTVHAILDAARGIIQGAAARPRGGVRHLLPGDSPTRRGGAPGSSAKPEFLFLPTVIKLKCGSVKKTRTLVGRTC
jgi:hypothetical protein